jgi:radical SAM protein with 4Fe4S-binding SPASM domain
MDWLTFVRIVSESFKYGPRSFSLHGFGEPTMDKNLASKMRLIKHYNKKNNIILTTNGVKVIPEAYDLADKIIITYRAPYNLDKYKPWKHKIMIRNFTNIPVPGTWRCENKQYHNFGGNVKSDIKTSHRYPCYHLWLSPMIAWNGDILLCCNDPEHKTKLGNINEVSLAEIWQEDALLDDIRIGQKNGTYVGICKDCNVWQTYKSIV